MLTENKNPNQLINDFLNEFEKIGHSPESKKNYKRYLQRFLLWSKITSTDQINHGLIVNYQKFLASLKHQNKPLKNSTKNYHLIALRSFLKYLYRRQIINLPIKEIKLDQPEKNFVTYLSTPDLEKILQVPLKTQEAKLIQLRDKALLELLFSSGLKVSQLAKLKINDLDFKNNQIKITTKKLGNKKIFLANQTKFWLVQYIEKRLDDHDYLFIRYDRAADSNSLKNLTPRSIQRLLQNYARMVGIKNKVTPQSFRKNLAHNLIQRGEKIEAIKEKLFYQSILSPKRYI